MYASHFFRKNSHDTIFDLLKNMINVKNDQRKTPSTFKLTIINYYSDHDVNCFVCNHSVEIDTKVS